MRFLLFLLCYLLLLEWLWPLPTLADIDRIFVFVIFIALCFSMSYFQMPFILSSIVKLLYIFITLYSLFYQGGFWNFAWFISFFDDVRHSILLIIQGDWWNLSGGFRSLCFFILLWVITYFLIYWLFVYRWLFIFLCLTIVYIAILDTFTPFQAKFAIIRVVLEGFLLLSILSFNRLLKNEMICEMKSLIMMTKWMTSIVLLLIGTMTISFFAPKANPYLADPIPFIRSYSESAGASQAVIGKAGYDRNDSYLGGPFIRDDSTVFISETTEENYWRVETKDYYTGKGWESTLDEQFVEMGNENTFLTWNNDAIKSKPAHANLHIITLANHLIYPIGLKHIQTDSSVYFKVNQATERIVTTNKKGDFISLNYYSFQYDYPTYSINALENVQLSDIEKLDSTFLATYTQLPNTLPNRVYELAEEITRDKSNLYEKVRAVNDYFRMNSFVYDTQNVALPGKRDDYVDQFLFDTKRGYCDNFSSSMVVLLRAVGIPARWVKGYTQGEFIEDIGSMKKFEITNNNAHSWVEVYYPKIGWVPSEPTIGFSNPADFDYHLEELQQSSQTNLPEVKKNEPKTEIVKKQTSNEKSNWLFFSWERIILFIIAMLFSSFVIFKTKLKWLPYLTILRYKYRRDEKVYFVAYMALIKQLESLGIKKKDGQTLREYAIYVDQCFAFDKMKKLTESYEKALYSRNLAVEEWEKSLELWENLIKKSVS